MSSRIAISGVGLVSALGQSANASFAALCAGERGIRPLSLFDSGEVRSKLAAEVPNFRVEDVAPASERDVYSRTDALALAAAREAAAQAGLPSTARLGVALGGTTGGMFETENLLSSPELTSLSAARARDVVSYPLSASIGRISQVMGGARVARTICSACSGGAVALVQAVAWLRAGLVDFALAGGADGLCRLTVLGFNALGATDPAPCRPFDRRRAGLNLGEGAAALVLEREETALARGAEVLAWLDGYAIGAEAHHITHPEPSGHRAAQLLRTALGRAGLTASDVGYVSAHGTGTQQNDAMEARALLDVLGEGTSTWVSSSKAQLGHTLGAAGAVEAVLSVLALSRGKVLPGLGLEEPEFPGLRYAPSRAVDQRLGAALSSSFGFGGMSCVLAFSARDRAAPPLAQPARRVALVAGAALDAAATPETSLDPERSRRFDSASALAAAGAAALSPPSGTGLVLGSAFGNVERTMAFLARGREKGARHVPPAEFPHLVPSAPAGNASIYAGLSGPVFAVSELEHCGEAAFDSACDLIELGVAEQLVAGAIAPRDAIVEQVLAPLLEPASFRAQARGHGAGFVLLRELQAARREGGASAVVLARLSGLIQGADALSGLPAPGNELDALVLGAASHELRTALAASPWARAPLTDLVAAHGYHEALGALGLAAALELLRREGTHQVLFLSGGSREYHAVLLGRVSQD